jgi:very-short-patch-repair endonuclease
VTDNGLLRLVCNHLAEQARTTVEYEHRFHPVRRWRFDAAFPERKIAIEIDGGAFIGGRHTRGTGFRKDCEKLNTATQMGWRVFRFLPDQVDGEMVNVITEVLERSVSKNKRRSKND